MKKTVRLTESDLARIVKRTIMELNKSTYDKAADAATERGFSKLGNKFRDHGKEFGLNQDENKLNFMLNLGDSDDEHIKSEFKVMGAELVGDSNKTYNIKLQSLKSLSTMDLTVTKIGNRLSFSLDDRYRGLPMTRKDGRFVLKLLGEQGFDVNDVDVRSINYNDSGF